MVRLSRYSGSLFTSSGMTWRRLERKSCELQMTDLLFLCSEANRSHLVAARRAEEASSNRCLRRSRNDARNDLTRLPDRFDEASTRIFRRHSRCRHSKQGKEQAEDYDHSTRSVQLSALPQLSLFDLVPRSIALRC